MVEFIDCRGERTSTTSNLQEAQPSHCGTTISRGDHDQSPLSATMMGCRRSSHLGFTSIWWSRRQVRGLLIISNCSWSFSLAVPPARGDTIAQAIRGRRLSAVIQQWLLTPIRWPVWFRAAPGPAVLARHLRRGGHPAGWRAKPPTREFKRLEMTRFSAALFPGLGIPCRLGSARPYHLGSPMVCVALMGSQVGHVLPDEFEHAVEIPPVLALLS